jgi:membrane-associated protease RseP (regulator of RpoE activity)
VATHSPSNRSALRTFVVVALSLLVLVAGGLDLRRIWIPIGLFGYQANGDEVVIFVADGSPAAKAGMQVGDRVDLQSTPVRFRYYVAQAGTLASGQSPTFGLIHRGVRRIVTLTAIPQVTEAQRYYTT